MSRGQVRQSRAHEKLLVTWLAVWSHRCCFHCYSYLPYSLVTKPWASVGSPASTTYIYGGKVLGPVQPNIWHVSEAIARKVKQMMVRGKEHQSDFLRLKDRRLQIYFCFGMR